MDCQQVYWLDYLNDQLEFYNDRDGDGFPNEQDAFPDDPNEWSDLDGDGIGDNSDPDRDGDGVPNAQDAFPDDSTEWSDTNGNGIGDNGDADAWQPILPGDAEVGTIAGKFATENGLASYNIPIFAPPGVAGVQPELSLNYSSQGGNGVAGLGWSLGGRSGIHRCPKTLDQDGQVGGITLTSNDRLCLDGQRLQAVSGTYGQNGTEYRTETESFSKVVSYGAQGGGPVSFKVWTKAGDIMEYGATADSRQEAPGKIIAMSWSLNKISDRLGNSIDFIYNENTSTGEQTLKEVRYANNRIVYSYTERPDISNGFMAGSWLTSTQRLSKIEVFSGSQLLRSYQLAYSGATLLAPSRLLGITECNGQGECLPSTTFAWQLEESDKLNGLWTAHSGGIFNNIVGDFNGDGMADFGGHTGNGHQWHMCYSTGNDFDCRYVQSHSAGVGKNITADFNGDNKADMAAYTGSGPQWHVCYSMGESFDCRYQDMLWAEAGETTHGDFNGDGLPDVAKSNGNHLWDVCYSNGNGFNCTTHAAHGGGVGNNATGDFNGDGMTDLAGHANDTTWHVCYSNGNGFDCQYQAIHGGGSGDNITADFNGDGMIDFATHDSGTLWAVCLSTGAGFTCRWDEIHGRGTNDNVTGDLNGDGRADLSTYDFTGERWTICLSVGEDFQCSLHTVHSAHPWDSYAADFNGDGLAEIAGWKGDTNWRIVSPLANSRQYVTHINNGVSQIDINYQRLNEGAGFYTPDANSVFPDRDLSTPLVVVESTAVDNGVGGQNTTRYRYGGMKARLQGRGNLGFRWVEEISETSKRYKRTEYRQDFPHIGSVKRVEECLLGSGGGTTSDSRSCTRSDGKLLNLAENTYATKTIFQSSGSTIFPFLSKSVHRSYELDGQLTKTVTSDSSGYDNYGNVGVVQVTTAGAGKTFVKKTSNTYENPSTYDWVLGRLSQSVTTHSASGVPAMSRTATFTYYTSGSKKGMLKTETIDPNGELRQVTSHEYDNFGNKTKTTISGENITSRYTLTSYDAAGRFPVSTSNSLGHQETYVYDAAYGNLLAQTGPNGLTTTWAYDTWGRKTKETRSDGTTTQWSIHWSFDCSGAPALASRCLIETSSGNAPRTVYKDTQSRTVRTRTIAFDGTPVYLDTVFNTLGEAVKVSRPYSVLDAPIWSTTTYDAIGRPIKIEEPWTLGRTVETTTQYSAHTTIQTDALGRTKTAVKDVMGRIVSVNDNGMASSSYQYDAMGNLIETRDPGGNVVRMQYDHMGNKIAMDDPDMGHWEYQYNALGELIKQVDAKGQAVTMTYDPLGRLIQREEPEGLTHWEYDNKHSACPTTAYGGKGNVSRVTRGTGILADNDYEKIYCYDDIGRVSKTIVRVEDEEFVTVTGYDVHSRPVVVNYPANNFTVKNVYNDHGYLEAVKSPQPSGGDITYWEAQERDYEGRLTQILHGNGLITYNSYDERSGQMQQSLTGTTLGSGDIRDHTYKINEVNNIVERHDYVNDIHETFGYDGLDRLITANITSATHVNADYNTQLTYDYDAMGNITHKSDVGDYVYGNNSPHQLTKAGDAFFSYDKNGNMVQGGDATIEWTSFNKPSAIARSTYANAIWGSSWGGFSNATGIMGPLTMTEEILPEIWQLVTDVDTPLRLARTSFKYGPDRARYKKVGETSEGNITTWYMDQRYERIDDGVNSQVLHKFYIYAGDALAAVHIQKGSGTEKTTRYLHTDSLNSVDTVTDENGQVVDRTSYKPFGGKRLPVGPTDPATTRGFTGHEHINEIEGLIHMNGRVYNSIAGRFLSADPHIQDPYNTQNLNRYSYVLNNPLKYNDPSGFYFKKLWKEVARAVSKVEGLNVVVQAVGCYVAGPFCGAFLAAWNAGVTYGATGSLSAGLEAGLISGAAAWLGGVVGGNFDPGTWQNILGNGVVGGAVSDATGGDFGRGFLSSAFAAAAKPGLFDSIGEGTDFTSTVARTMAAATIGGTASKITGGKFANGASAAAFSHLVNGETTLRAQVGQGAGQVGRSSSAPGGDASNALSTNAAGEFKRCVSSCIQERYGSSYEAAEALNPLSVSGLVGNEVSEVLETELQKQGNRNSYGNSKEFRAGQRQLRTLSQFRKFNAASLVIGAGAIGFQIGAQGYCRVECIGAGE